MSKAPKSAKRYPISEGPTPVFVADISDMGFSNGLFFVRCMSPAMEDGKAHERECAQLLMTFEAAKHLRDRLDFMVKSIEDHEKSSGTA